MDDSNYVFQSHHYLNYVDDLDGMDNKNGFEDILETDLKRHDLFLLIPDPYRSYRLIFFTRFKITQLP